MTTDYFITRDRTQLLAKARVFNYDNTKHNVFKVNGTLFQSCTFPPENEALSTGKDIIQLKTEGRKWYICGKADHCAARQMKFVITVIPSQEGSAWSPSPSSSPSPAPASAEVPAPTPSAPWTATVPHFGLSLTKKLYKVFHH